MKKAWLVALVVSLLPLVAPAAIPRAGILRQVESSMLVKGSIEINPDGSVDTLVIDQPEKFSAGLVDFVLKQVQGWKFEPVLVDGKAMRARSPMSLRVVANAVGADSYSIAIRNASFDGEPPKEGEGLASKWMGPPRYPELVARSGASGTVYVVVKIDRQGRVVDAVAEQVNLRTIGADKEMEAWRKALADAAIKAARKWTYAPPVRGELADDESWSVRVPCDFRIDDRWNFVYGKWDQYIPGPRQSIPWSDEDSPGFSPDLLAAGGVYMIGHNKGPKLLTPLDGT